MYPNVENMIAMPLTKRVEIIMSIQVCLISLMNFDYKENGGNRAFWPIQSINIVYPNAENIKKAFLANPKINIMYPNMENMIAMS